MFSLNVSASWPHPSPYQLSILDILANALMRLNEWIRLKGKFQ